jgi:hypothetical protein
LDRAIPLTAIQLEQPSRSKSRVGRLPIKNS